MYANVLHNVIMMKIKYKYDVIVRGNCLEFGEILLLLDNLKDVLVMILYFVAILRFAVMLIVLRN